MYNIRRFYNKHRKEIWTILMIIAFCIIILQVLNNIAGKNNVVHQQEQATNVITQNKKENSNVKITSNKSVVTGEEVISEQLETQTSKVKEFLVYCSKGQIQEAYNLLTPDCKEEMYNTVENFERFYCSKIPINQEINCNVENWAKNTYKVRITEDILSTGRYNKEEAIQDYITVVKVNEEYKLNINSYIGRTQIDNTGEKDGVKITALSKDTYMDYEKYNLKIENNTENDILLDNDEDVKSMYIQDSNNVKYSAYKQELSSSDLIAQSNSIKLFTVKYYSSYVSTKRMKDLVFSKVIMNYDIDRKTYSQKHIVEIKVKI